MGVRVVLLLDVQQAVVDLGQNKAAERMKSIRKDGLSGQLSACKNNDRKVANVSFCSMHE